MIDIDIDRIVSRFAAAFGSGDAAELDRLYAPDATVWHNDGAGPQPRDQNIASLTFLAQSIRDLRYDIQRRVTTPSCAYQQHVVRGVLPSGEEIAVDACLYFEIENGRITKVEEYFDPGAATAIVTALQSG